MDRDQFPYLFDSECGKALGDCQYGAIVMSRVSRSKLRNWLRKFKLKRKGKQLSDQCQELCESLRVALDLNKDSVPVIVVSYNNGTYVKNMVEQLSKFTLKPIVIDNASTDGRSLEILQSLSDSGVAHIVRSAKNFGHLVGFLDPVYPCLPDVFAYTDPDLQLNEALPMDFLSVLAGLTMQYEVYKAGFALDLLHNEPIITGKFEISNRHPMHFQRQYSVREWESRYWKRKLMHESLDVWAANLDTTFAVYRKQMYNGYFLDGVRVGGNYSAIHLPWFSDRDLLEARDLDAYKSGNVSSAWVR